MSALTRARAKPGVRALYAGNARSVMERGLLATRSTNWVITWHRTQADNRYHRCKECGFEW